MLKQRRARRVPLTRIASSLRYRLSPQAGRGEPAGTAELKQQPHQDQILVLPVDLAGVALEALGDEAEFLVERDRVFVVLAHGKLDAGEAEGARGVERLLHQAGSKPLVAELRQKAHSQDA